MEVLAESILNLSISKPMSSVSKSKKSLTESCIKNMTDKLKKTKISIEKKESKCLSGVRKDIKMYYSQLSASEQKTYSKKDIRGKILYIRHVLSCKNKTSSEIKLKKPLKYWIKNIAFEIFLEIEEGFID